MTIALHLIQILQRPRITVSSISFFFCLFFTIWIDFFLHLECDDTWTLQTIGSRSLCFKHLGDTTWDAGNALCAAEGASLFMPLNAQENNEFYSYTVSLSLSGVWLDGIDTAVENEWRTSSGDLITYFNWQGGQPDNAGGIEDYIHYHAPWGANWNDITPSYTENVLCQKPPTRKSSCSQTTGCQQCWTSTQYH